MVRLVSRAVHSPPATCLGRANARDGDGVLKTPALEDVGAGSATGTVKAPSTRSSIALSFLVWCVSAAGVFVFAMGLWTWDGSDLAALLILALLGLAAERFDFNLYGDSRVSLAFVPIFGAIVLGGFAGLALVVPVALMGSALGQGRPFHKTVYNFGALMIAGATSLLVIYLFGTKAHPGAWPEALPPAILAAGVNFTINSIIVTIAISLSNRNSVGSVWNEHFAWLGPHYLVMGLLGLSLVAAYELMGLWGIAVFLAPPLMMRLSLKQYIDRTTNIVLQLRRANEELKSRNRQLIDARAQAATDALTGLGNHRAFHERSRSEVQEATRIGSHLSLIMLDIDGFKIINDSHGHQRGDKLLSDLAEVLTDVVSHADTYRYGGDEFAILLPETDKRAAEGVAERVRRAVAEQSPHQTDPPTISLGVATFPGDATSAQELIYQADAAMYWAKSSGKNRVGTGHRPPPLNGAATMHLHADGKPS